MQQVFSLIKYKQQAFAKLPLFKFMEDCSILPRQRLSFAPCAAHFIMGFADLNKYVLRQEPTDDRIQQIINQHSYEDDYHWQWFLEDIEKLNFNPSLKLNDTLKFLWSEETKTSRLLVYELYQHIFRANSLNKLVILEVMEAAADVFFARAVKIVRELQITTNQEYRYFGHCHAEAENDHNANTDEVQEWIANIHLTTEARQESLELVETVFKLFTTWTNGLLMYAEAYQTAQTSNSTQDIKKLLIAA